MQPAEAVREPSRPVAAVPEDAVAVDERVELGRRGGLARPPPPSRATRRPGGVPGRRRSTAPTRSMLKRTSSISCRASLRSGRARGGGACAVQAGVDRVELRRREPRGQAAADGELRVVEVHDQRRHVGELRRDEEMGIAEGEDGIGQGAGGVAEDVRAERRSQVEIPVRREAPRYGGAVGESRLADDRLLQVAQVAPVGVEVPGRLRGPTRPRRRGGRWCARW